MDLRAILHGPQKVANNLNKGLYLIFGRFVQYFYRKLDEIDAGGTPTAKQKQLRAVAIEVMNEFEAPERRLYIQKAFDHRVKITDSVILPKSFKGSIGKLIHVFTVEPGLLKRMRTMIKEMRLELLEICNQSLSGFQSFIYAYQNFRLDKKIPDFNIDKINKVGPNEYTLDDRDILSGLIEELKETVGQKYFHFEMEIRMMRQAPNNLSAFTIELLRDLRALLGPGQNRATLPGQLAALKAKAFARFRDPIDNIAISDPRPLPPP